MGTWSSVWLVARTSVWLVTRTSVWLVLYLLAFSRLVADESTFPILTQERLTTFTDKPQAIYGDEAIYRVYRNDKPIGRHLLTFTATDNGIVIDVDSELIVRVLGVAMYRYKYTASETWRSGELVSVETRIKDNRKAEKLIRAESQDTHWSVSKGDAAPRSVVAPRYAVNHWHPGALYAKRIYHPVHGRVYRGEPVDKGQERVALEDGTVVGARRYSYKAGFVADVWYDADWRWIKLEFNADDGSLIVYKCQRCQPVSLPESLPDPLPFVNLD